MASAPRPVRSSCRNLPSEANPNHGEMTPSNRADLPVGALPDTRCCPTARFRAAGTKRCSAGRRNGRIAGWLGVRAAGRRRIGGPARRARQRAGRRRTRIRRRRTGRRRAGVGRRWARIGRPGAGCTRRSGRTGGPTRFGGRAGPGRRRSRDRRGRRPPPRGATTRGRPGRSCDGAGPRLGDGRDVLVRRHLHVDRTRRVNAGRRQDRMQRRRHRPGRPSAWVRQRHRSRRRHMRSGQSRGVDAVRGRPGAGQRGDPGPEQGRADQQVPRADLPAAEGRQVQPDGRVLGTAPPRAGSGGLPHQSVPRLGLGPRAFRVSGGWLAEVDRRIGFVATRTFHQNVPH